MLVIDSSKTPCDGSIVVGTLQGVEVQEGAESSPGGNRPPGKEIRSSG